MNACVTLNIQAVKADYLHVHVLIQVCSMHVRTVSVIPDIPGTHKTHFIDMELSIFISIYLNDTLLSLQRVSSLFDII